MATMAAPAQVTLTTTRSTKVPQRAEHKNALWVSLAAGAGAGVVEGALTYPFEYAKTMMQLRPAATPGIAVAPQVRNPLSLIYSTASTRGLTALYTGCSTLVVGTAFKASVRFLGFDSMKSLLSDRDGKLTSTRSVLAGTGAGVMESLLVVTPFETVKTALIEDGRRQQPRYRGMLHGTFSLIREQGLGGVYRGVVAVTARQGLNSTMRIGSFTVLKDLVQSQQKVKSEHLGPITSFGLGCAAGVITVYTTAPIDTIKTRMQSLSAKSEYRSTLDCAAKIIRNEGVKAFWNGSTARLARMMVGSAIFCVYVDSEH